MQAVPDCAVSWDSYGDCRAPKDFTPRGLGMCLCIWMTGYPAGFVRKRNVDVRDILFFSELFRNPMAPLVEGSDRIAFREEAAD